MSENRERTPQERRKRVQRLKRLIIAGLICAILIPCGVCVVLLLRIHGLQEELAGMTIEVGKLQELVGQLQEAMPVWETVTQDEAEPMAEENQDNETPVMESIEPPEDQTDEGLHKVYLTFDDGPSSYTDEILQILDTYGVKATFFVVGKEDAASQEAMNNIVEAGHTLGMHSYTHKYSELYHSLEDFSEDCVRLQEYLHRVTGVTSLVYRFPGGSSNRVSTMDMQEGIDYLHSQGIEYYDWNVSSGDGGSRLLDVDTLTENCLGGIEERGTSIILLHDASDKSTTVEALPEIIESIMAMEDTVILPITEETEPVWHIQTTNSQ